MRNSLAGDEFQNSCKGRIIFQDGTEGLLMGNFHKAKKTEKFNWQ